MLFFTYSSEIKWNYFSTVTRLVWCPIPIKEARTVVDCRSNHLYHPKWLSSISRDLILASSSSCVESSITLLLVAACLSWHRIISIFRIQNSFYFCLYFDVCIRLHIYSMNEWMKTGHSIVQIHYIVLPSHRQISFPPFRIFSDLRRHPQFAYTKTAIIWWMGTVPTYIGDWTCEWSNGSKRNTAETGRSSNFIQQCHFFRLQQTGGSVQQQLSVSPTVHLFVQMQIYISGY